MNTSRLEAFSDGVIAILITIMVLELRVPQGSGFAALRPLLPVFLTYILSFVYLGIYWVNHHHMLYATEEIRGGVLWANLHLLFWLSLVPVATGWMGSNHFEPVPTACYGIVLLMAGVSYTILQAAILACGGRNAKLREAIGRDRKGKLSLALYSAAIVLAFVNQWIADAIYVAVAAMWLVPDRRIEDALGSRQPARAAE